MARRFRWRDADARDVLLIAALIGIGIGAGAVWGIGWGVLTPSALVFALAVLGK